MSLSLGGYTPTTYLEIPLTNMGINSTGAGGTAQMFSGAFAVDIIIPAGQNGAPVLRTDCTGTASLVTTSLMGYLVDGGQ